MRIFSDFNRKIITTCVDICELPILMNVLRVVSLLPCLWENMYHDVQARDNAAFVVVAAAAAFCSIPLAMCVLSNFQTASVITYWAVIKLAFVVTYGGFLENLHPLQINAVYIWFYSFECFRVFFQWVFKI